MANRVASVVVGLTLAALIWFGAVDVPQVAARASDQPSLAADGCAEARASRVPSGAPAPPSVGSDDVYVFEGELVEELFCVLLESDFGFGMTFELTGDLEGFGPGDHVVIEGKPCSGCYSVCMTGNPILEVLDISGAAGVGGVAELPPHDSGAFASEGRGGGSLPLGALIGLAGAAFLAGALRVLFRRPAPK